MMWYRFVNFAIQMIALISLAICYVTPSCKKHAMKIMKMDEKKKDGFSEKLAATCGLCFEDFQNDEEVAEV